MIVRVTQIDGILPNLALMQLSAWHKAQGDDVHFSRSPHKQRGEPTYDRVYGSAIFKFSRDRIAKLQDSWPAAILGGTGTGDRLTVEELTGPSVGYDYSLYPDFAASIGFTQRGCRFKCSFCVVPKKEGAPVSTGTLRDLWRGPGFPRKLHLLDNDFFGQAKSQWKARLAEAREEKFKLCFNQGINIRVVTDEIATELAQTEYRDDSFSRRRLYTAWDSLGDEALFFRGVDKLEAAGVPPKHLMAYMLVGFDPEETWPAVFHRFEEMIARGIRPYPMVFDCRETDPDRYRELKRFQRWVVTGLYRAVPWGDYDARVKRSRDGLYRHGVFA